MPAIASGSQPPPVTAAVAPITTTLTNGLPPATLRSSQPTTPSRPVLQQTNHSNLNHHNNATVQQQGTNHNNMTGSCEKAAVINLVDEEEEDQDSKSSLGASRPKHLSNSVVTNHNNHRIGSNSNSNSGTGGVGTALIGGPGLTIPTELTNFYLKNKKIIDGSDVRGVVPTKTTTPIKEEPHTVDTNHFLAEEMEVGDVDARDGKHKRKGRKKGAKGFDSLLGSSQTNLFSSNSNSGFADGGSSTMHPTTASSTVGKKVKTTRQLVAEMKFRNEQNLRQSSYPDLSNDQEHNNNNNNGLSSSPLSMASNDSQQHHLFHHHHHNQHGGHDLVFHSAPVTPSGYAAAVKREDGHDQELSASARKREKKRRKLEKEQAAAAAAKKFKAKVKREKSE